MPARLDQSELDRIALDAAYAQAVKSQSEGGIPIGSAIVDASGKIIAAGHNQRVQQGDTTAHAEVDCIRKAGRRADWPTLTLASTLSPCIMCSGTAALHRVGRVVIGENATFQGAEWLMRLNGIELRVVNDPRCVKLMHEFIHAKPELWYEDIGIAPTTPPG